MPLFPPRVVAREELSDDPSWSLREGAPLLIMHVALIGILFVGVSPAAVIALAVTYSVRVFALTGGYHRYFSHNSYRTGRAFQFILAFLGASAGQLGPLWWAAHHRHHHTHSDDPADVHSPRQQGLLHAHLGWLMCPKYAKADRDLIRDFMCFPELRWIDRFHAVAPLTLAAFVFAVGHLLHVKAGVNTSGAQFLVWGFVVSTVLGYHATFSINSLTHVFGRRRFATRDDSRNSLLLALVTMGEGWHNNHHRYPVSARQGFFPWEVDFTYYILLLLERLGVIWDVRRPPAAVYAEARTPGGTTR